MVSRKSTPKPIDAEIISAVKLCPGIKELRLRRADRKIFDYVPGQHVVLRDGTDSDGECYYSIASPPRKNGDFAICVKQDESECSSMLFDRVAGDHLSVEGPLGEMVLDDEPRDLLLVATGTGIAAFHSMLDLLRLRAAASKVILLHGVRSHEELIYQPSWAKLNEKRQLFDYHTTVTKPDETWNGAKGRVTRLVQDILPTVRLVNAHAYVCGVRQAVQDVVIQLQQLGYGPKEIFTDLKK